MEFIMRLSKMGRQVAFIPPIASVRTGILTPGETYVVEVKTIKKPVQEATSSKGYYRDLDSVVGAHSLRNSHVPLPRVRGDKLMFLAVSPQGR